MNSKNNPKILNDFNNYLLGIRGCSNKTIESYDSDLLLFFDFIKKYMNISAQIKEFDKDILLKVKEADIIAFLVYCNYSKDNNPYTRQRKLTSIRSFYRWMLSIIPGGFKIQNPTKNIENIQKVVRLPKCLSLDEAKRIQTIFTLKNSNQHLRNNTIICLFLHTGIRLSELINIDFKDINMENSSIKVIGKFNKERTVYLDKYCKKQLQDYIDYRKRHQDDITPNSPLFLNNQKQRVGNYCVETICKKAYELMGLSNKNYTTHTLRHTAATIMYAYGKQDILVVKEFLGHSCLASTQIYTHLHPEQVRDAVNRNPLNKNFG